MASDYSENMLNQAYDFLTKEEGTSPAAETEGSSLMLVRADVGRLPFESKTFDLVITTGICSIDLIFLTG